MNYITPGGISTPRNNGRIRPSIRPFAPGRLPVLPSVLNVGQGDASKHIIQTTKDLSTSSGCVGRVITGDPTIPTFEFKCDVCGRTEETFIINPKNAPEAFDCPHNPPGRGDSCEGCVCPGVMRRQIGPGGGVIFRGPGFHCVDYRKAEPSKEEK